MSIIAIVDDNLHSLNSIKNKLQAIITTDFPNRGIELVMYSSGRDLLHNFMQVKPDLVILDYQMPELNGFETAVKIREFSNDVKIIFLTNYEQHWRRGYQVRAFSYIIKSDEEQIYIDLHEVIKSILDSKIEMSFQTRSGMISLSLDQLIYAESYARNMRFHLINHEKTLVQVNGGITSFYEKVKDHNFICPHISFCVNLKYITAVDSDQKGSYLTVKNGTDIGIARNKQKEVIDRISKYTERKLL